MAALQFRKIALPTNWGGRMGLRLLSTGGGIWRIRFGEVANTPTLNEAHRTDQKNGGFTVPVSARQLRPIVEQRQMNMPQNERRFPEALLSGWLDQGYRQNSLVLSIRRSMLFRFLYFSRIPVSSRSSWLHLNRSMAFPISRARSLS